MLLVSSERWMKRSTKVPLKKGFRSRWSKSEIPLHHYLRLIWKLLSRDFFTFLMPFYTQSIERWENTSRKKKDFSQKRQEEHSKEPLQKSEGQVDCHYSHHVVLSSRQEPHRDREKNTETARHPCWGSPRVFKLIWVMCVMRFGLQDDGALRPSCSFRAVQKYTDLSLKSKGRVLKVQIFSRNNAA